MRRIFTRRPDFEIVARRDFSDLTYLLEIRHPMLARVSRPGHGRKAAPWGSAGNTVPWCVRLAGARRPASGPRPERAGPPACLPGLLRVSGVSPRVDPN